jgi:hypothetical protein
MSNHSRRIHKEMEEIIVEKTVDYNLMCVAVYTHPSEEKWTRLDKIQAF